MAPRDDASTPKPAAAPRPPDDWQRDLRDGVLQAVDAFARGVGPELKRAAEDVRDAVANRHERRAERRRRLHEERLALIREKAELRRARREAAAAEGGSRYGFVAAVLMGIALVSGHIWLLFIALPFLLKYARTSRRAPAGVPTRVPVPVPVPVPDAGVPELPPEPVRAPPRMPEPARAPAPAAERVAPAPPPAPPCDPRDTRTDELCDRLLDELKQAPESIRTFLGGRPEDTVEILRRTCHDLLRRERALRADAGPDEHARLDREHAALSTRIDAETDEVAKLRLLSALSAIEEQRGHRQVLLRNANRLDAEHTRLAWTLESLSAQLVRLRSTGADPASAGIGTSVGRLKDQLSALADALEDATRPEWRLSDATAPSVEPPVPSGRSGAATESGEPSALARRGRERA